MASTPAPKPPVSTTDRAKNFLLYGFGLSIVLHLIAGPFVNFHQTHTAEEEQPQKVTVARIPTPPPTPPPTPTPKPTPPPTPPPKSTPPPVKSTPAPVQPRIKINTAKTESNTHSGTTEQSNKYTTGNTQGVPQGVPTNAPVVPAAKAATPAPATPPPPTPTPLSCARPNVPAATVRAQEPDMPAMAQQQGISGTVNVIVSLSATSQVVGTKIQSSPSALLNSAAQAAARQSTFQTEIRDCKPIAADYIFSVEFSSQ